jgi:hypothetical protein
MTLPKRDGEQEELNKGGKSQVIYCNKTTYTRQHAPVMMMSTTHASSADPAAVPTTPLARPLRTLNNINSAPHVIQLHPNNSPKLSGKEQKESFIFSSFQLKYFLPIYFKCVALLLIFEGVEGVDLVAPVNLFFF